MNIAGWINLALSVALLVAFWSAFSRASHWRAEYLEAQKQLAWKGEEWHALNEEMRVTLEERDHFRQQTYAALDRITSQRAAIKLLRLRCQEARNDLRKFCSRPSQMMDVIDKLEKDFAEDSKSN